MRGVRSLTVMSESWAEILIELLPTEKGGRDAPLDLSNDRPGQYRPHLRVIGGSGQMLGVAFMDGPDDPVSPGGRHMPLSNPSMSRVFLMRN